MSAGTDQPAAGQALAHPRVVEDLGHGARVRSAQTHRRTHRSCRPSRAGCSGCSNRGRARATAGQTSVSPMSRSKRSATSIISSTLKPMRRRLDRAFGSVARCTAGSVAESGPAGRTSDESCAVRRGKRMRARSGNDASTPRTPVKTAPKRKARLPSWNRSDTVPSTRRVCARRRVCFAELGLHLLGHPVLGPDHHRAQRREVGVGGALVIDRHAVKNPATPNVSTSGASSSR